jgi:hypothetical protein
MIGEFPEISEGTGMNNVTLVRTESVEIVQEYEYELFSDSRYVFSTNVL